jgi:hypothetical protein
MGVRGALALKMLYKHIIDFKKKRRVKEGSAATHQSLGKERLV